MKRVTFRVPGGLLSDVEGQADAGLWANRSEALRAGLRELPGVGEPEGHGRPRVVADGGAVADDPDGGEDAVAWTERLYHALTEDHGIPDRHVMVSGSGDTAFVSSSPDATTDVMTALKDLGANPTLRGGEKTASFAVSRRNADV